MERQVNNSIGKFLYVNKIEPNRVKKITLLSENTKSATRLIELNEGKSFLLSTTNYNTTPLFNINFNNKWFTFKVDESHTKDFLSFINEAEPAVAETPVQKPATPVQPDPKAAEQTKKAETLKKEEKYFEYLNNSLFPEVAKSLGTDASKLLVFVEGENQEIVDFFAKQLGLKSKKTNLSLPAGNDEFKDQIEAPLLFDYNGIKFAAFSKLNYLEYTQNQPKKAVVVSIDDFNKILDLDVDSLK